MYINKWRDGWEKETKLETAVSEDEQSETSSVYMVSENRDRGSERKPNSESPGGFPKRFFPIRDVTKCRAKVWSELQNHF